MKRFLILITLTIGLVSTRAVEATRSLQVYASAASLMNVNPTNTLIQTNVFVEGVVSSADGHAGFLTYYPASTATTNAYNCLKPNVAGGRWIRGVQTMSIRDGSFTNFTGTNLSVKDVTLNGADLQGSLDSNATAANNAINLADAAQSDATQALSDASSANANANSRVLIDAGTANNITISSGTLSGALAGGGNNIAFTSSGSVTPISLSDRATNVINAVDFGAIFDGVTPVDVPIQLALNRARDIGGGIVRLSPARAYQTNTLVIYSNTTLDGNKCTLVGKNGAFIGKSISGSTWYSSVVGVGVTNVHIYDLAIDHYTLSNTANGITFGLSATGFRPTNNLVGRVRIDGFNSHQYLLWNFKGDDLIVADSYFDGHVTALDSLSEQEGAETYGGTNVTFRNNTFINIGHAAINTTSDSTNNSFRSGLRFVNNHIRNSRVGISLFVPGGGAGIRDATIYGNDISRTWTRSIELPFGYNAEGHNIDISHNIINDTPEAITFYGVSGSNNVSNVSASYNSITNATGLNGAIFETFWPGVSLTRNSINGSSGDGIRVVSSGDTQIEGNTITKVQASAVLGDTVTNLIVNGNTIISNNIANSGSPGIRMAAVNKGVANRNTFGTPANQYYAVYIASGNDVEVRDNSLLYTAAVNPIFRNDSTSANSGAPKYMTLGGLSRLTATAANIMRMENAGTSASPVPQDYRVYKFFDGTDGESVGMHWNGSIAEIGTSIDGAGTLRPMRLLTAGNMYFNYNGVDRVIWAPSAMLFATDGAFNFGQSGSARPGNYFGAGFITTVGDIYTTEGSVNAPHAIFTNYVQSPFWLPQTDSTSGLRMGNAGATTNVLVADTVNTRIAIAMNGTAPSYALEVGSDIATRGTLRVIQNGVSSFDTTSGHPVIYATGNTGTDPFDANGNLIMSPGAPNGVRSFMIAGGNATTNIHLRVWGGAGSVGGVAVGNTPTDPGLGNLSVVGNVTAAGLVGSVLASAVTNSSLTASRLVVTDANKQEVSSATTATQAGYLSTTTSDVQVQINAKTDKATLTTKGDTYVATATSTPARLAVGTDGQIIIADSAAVTGWKWTNAPNVTGTSGTVINSGTPTDGAIPVYSGTTGTNITPSTVLIASGAVSATSGTFTNYLKGPYWLPQADSVTALRMANAASTTNLFVGDTTNMRIGVNGVNPSYTLEVGGDVATRAKFHIIQNAPLITDFDTTSGHPVMYATGNTGTDPFNANGNLVVSPGAPSGVRSFIIAGGNATTNQHLRVWGGAGSVGGVAVGNTGVDPGLNNLSVVGNVSAAGYGTVLATAITNTALTASRAVVSDANKALVSSATTATELGYVSGVTSAIQTQIDAKTPSTRTISTTAPITGGGDLSANRTIAMAASTDSVDGYMTAADHVILTGKLSKSIWTTKGDILSATASATPARLGVGSNGQILIADSTAAGGLTWTNAPTIPATSPTPTWTVVTLTTPGQTYTIPDTGYVVLCDAGGMAITLPTAVGKTGKTCIIKATASAQPTYATVSSQTVDRVIPSPTSMASSSSGYTFMSDGANWYIISGL